jgi:hypothetical protein
MHMSVQFNNMTIELDGIYTVLVSDIQPDTDTDAYVRILTIFDQPVTEGNRTPVLTLRLFGGSQSDNDQAAVQIQTPRLVF